MFSGTQSRIPGGGADGSPKGSPPAPDGLEKLARSRDFLLVVEGMSVSFVHAYTVAMARGHPGNGEIEAGASVVSGLDGVAGASDAAGVCSSVVARILVPCEPAHSLAWEPCPEPGIGAASPLFSIDSQ